MKDKILNIIRKKPALVALLAIFILGSFLRMYHFSGWLHFELDQSRDAKVINLAIQEGPSNLPLLGPKAAGTFLRLGPLFYYFKYLSALVFGNTPSGVAVIIMIFGILAIPVFYLFVKRYFNERLSLGLTLLFSVSLFFVMYSRFSWNPNPLPLFTLLTFYSLLKTADKEEKSKNIWFLIMAFSLAVATQMHFLAFVAVPSVCFIFLAIKRPKIKIGYWIGAIAIVLFLYTPAVINDLKTGGNNISQFAKVASGKSSKSDHNILEKAIKNYTENSLGYFLLISSQESQDLPRVILGSKSQSLICDSSCKKGLGLGAVSFIFFTTGIIFLIINLRREKEQKRKDFLILVFLWFFLVFGLYTPISFNIAPRFWLLVSAIPFIFLGFILEYINAKLKNIYTNKAKLISGTTLAVIVLLAITNLWAVKQRFWQMANAPYQSFEIGPDRILKERTRVTLEQQYMVINYVKSIYEQNKYPVYLNSEPFYRRSLLFELDQINIPENDFRNATGSKKVYEHGNYFLVQPTGSNIDAAVSGYANNYSVSESRQFGTLTAIRLVPKSEAVNAVEQDFSKSKTSKSAPGVPVRYKWEQIFNDSAGDESATN